MKAIWNNTVLAESDNTVQIEGNHYFPNSSLNRAHFKNSSTTTYCPWKGEASYYNIDVNGEINKDAAWYYADPKPAAAAIKAHIAFWRGVEITQ